MAVCTQCRKTFFPMSPHHSKEFCSWQCLANAANIGAWSTTPKKRENAPERARAG